ncbi:lysophospholipid acyltransferase family protein [Jatrophihabitans endophyticus]|uniref:lysophospholipid acyltransferase family protein n=1 Tax=Jatrophihabitans endophyticus TaxID=1206085 RepID=UPI0019F0D752|nr:lysophospholipid acyltransferase family protein [Jatrophihabitans endophyticus]MBE7189717.1 1-acyl-sn-glycerol-3-phosphate acyltransferase [Jatrophihabitans endophyticus]
MKGDPVYRGVIRVFRVVFRMLGLRFTLRGLDNVPTDGPAVLACNHLSYLDFTFVGLAATHRRRLVRFMAKQSVFDNRVSGPLMRAMRHIPVDRASGAAAYRRAARAVAAGELVGIFPEATISRSWELKSFKLGAATLAVREQVPLVPVVLWGAQRTFTTDKRYSFGRGKAITVALGAPIVAAPTDSPLDVDAELRRRMQELLDAARRDYPDVPTCADDRWWLPASCGGTAPSLDRAAELEAAATARRAARNTARA